MLATRILADFERSLAPFDEVTRLLDHVLYKGPAHSRRTRVGPRVVDDGKDFVIRLLVPGAKEENISLEATEDGLSISVTVPASQPEGYELRHRETTGAALEARVPFPTKVDPQSASAELRNGVLEFRIEKARAAQPRKIAVESAARKGELR